MLGEWRVWLSAGVLDGGRPKKPNEESSSLPLSYIYIHMYASSRPPCVAPPPPPLHKYTQVDAVELPAGRLGDEEDRLVEKMRAAREVGGWAGGGCVFLCVWLVVGEAEW
jgi:hypothetical protein